MVSKRICVYIHQSGVLIFLEKSVFTSFQYPKLTNQIPLISHVLKMVEKPQIGVYSTSILSYFILTFSDKSDGHAQKVIL